MLPDVLKALDSILKVNTRVAESVGFMYLSYLKRIFADLMKMEVIENQVKVADNKVVTFPSETNTFLIETDGKRRNTKITDPQKLYVDEFKGHEHNQ